MLIDKELLLFSLYYDIYPGIDMGKKEKLGSSHFHEGSNSNDNQNI